MIALTTARRRGLEVLAAREKSKDANKRHRSFRTNTTNLELGQVYWQTADWLIDNGLAEEVSGLTVTGVIQLTNQGRDLARDRGLL